jgi:hypothetical protein
VKPILKTALALAFLATAGAAHADSCSGHSHTTGTVLGAAGGATIGGLASHSVGGAIVGGVVGGVAGNAIARSRDCRHYRRKHCYWSHGRKYCRYY